MWNTHKYYAKPFKLSSHGMLEGEGDCTLLQLFNRKRLELTNQIGGF